LARFLAEDSAMADPHAMRAAFRCAGAQRLEPWKTVRSPGSTWLGKQMARVVNRGDIAAGMSVMLMLSVLLSWIPGFGTLVAGIVGGKLASGFGAAFVAALLPGAVIGVLLFFLATLFTGLPLIGVVAGMGGLTLAGTQVAALLLGAIIGGLLAH
jgi:hypothetical protein